MSEDAVSTNDSGGAAQVLRPVSGDGLLARDGELILLCGLEAGGVDKVHEVLGVLHEVAAAGGDGRRLGRRLARLMSAGDEDDYPALCALGPAGVGWAVLVHGAAELVADTARGEVHLDGADAVTWVDRILPGPVIRLRAVLTGPAGPGRSAGELESGPGTDWFRLDAGTVPAGGLRLEPAGASGPGGVDSGSPGGSGSGGVGSGSAGIGSGQAGVAGGGAGGAADPVGTAGVPADPAGVPGGDLTAASDPLTHVFTTDEHEDANTTEPLRPEDADAGSAQDDAVPAGRESAPDPLLPDVSSTYRAGADGDASGGDRPVPGEESWTLPPDRPAEPYGTSGRDRQVDADNAVGGLAGLGAPRPSLGARLGGALAANGSRGPGAGGAPAGEALSRDALSRDAQARDAEVRGAEAVDPLSRESRSRAAEPRVAGGTGGDFGGDERTETVPADARPRPAQPAARALVLDDGSVHPLEQGYVVGRDPDRDPDVTAGRALPLQVLDPEGVVSRAHARIEVDGSTVRVVDLGSANGTHVLEPGGDSWTRVPPHVGLELVPGMLVAVGARQLRYTTDDDI